MSTTKTKVCLICAKTQKLKWLPCPDHSPVVDPALCRHDFTSQTLIHNGVGIKCHDCGSHVTLDTVDDSDTCQTCGDLIAGGNPFSTHCDTCLDKDNN